MKFLLFNCTGLTDTKVTLLWEQFTQHDILLLTETWEDHDKYDLPVIYGFHQYAVHRQKRNCKAKRGSGGVALYFKQHLIPFISVWQPSHSSSSVDSCIWVKVSKEIGLDKDLYICLCYIQSPGSVMRGCVDYRSSADMDVFEWLIESISEANGLGNTLLAGDFNARTSSEADYADLEFLAQYLPELHGCDYILSGLQPTPRHSRDIILDSYGKELLNICKITQSIILNGRAQGDEHGEFTITNHQGNSSVVDYFIVDHDMYQHVQSLKVNEQQPETGVHRSLTLKIRLHNDKQNCNISLDDNVHGDAKIMRFKWETSRIDQYQQVLKQHIEQGPLMNLANSDAIDGALLGTMLQNVINTAAAEVFECKEVSYSTFPNRYLANKHFIHKPWFDEKCKQAKSLLQDLLRLEHDPKHMVANEVIAHGRRRYRQIIQTSRRLWVAKRNREMVEQVKRSPAMFWKQFNASKHAQHGGEISEEAWTAYFRSLLDPGSHELANNIREGNPVEEEANPPTAVELNGCITHQEVKEAMKNIHNNKAAGVDGIKGEFLKCATDLLIGPITTVFNKIFLDGSYPESWGIGIIHTLYKSGDVHEPSNYRGITVGTALSKLYACVLNNRITKWAESNNIRAIGQAGFRDDHRTVDQLFVINAIKDTYKAKKKSLFCCFVDFKKAFDLVNRTLLWRRLKMIGISGTMLSAIKTIYSNVTCKVKSSTGLGPAINSTIGVKQGCPLSPILFGLYIDSLEKELNDRCPDVGGMLNESRIRILLYADDIVLISETAEGLSELLDCLEAFCHEWLITVNTKKTKIMIFNNRRAFNNYSWLYKGEEIEIVTKFKYLGLELHSNKQISHCQAVLSIAGQRAMYAMMKSCKSQHITSIPLKCTLFDSLVAPVLGYGCELWAPHMFHSSGLLDSLDNPNERVHMKFCRLLLGVRKSTPRIIMLSELGRRPLCIHWAMQTMKYWNRMLYQLDDDPTRITALAVADNLELAKNGFDCWARSLHNLVGMIYGTSEVFDSRREIDVRVVENLLANALEQKITGNPLNVDGDEAGSKLLMYRQLRGQPGMQPYLQELHGVLRCILSKFRTGSHNLQVEVGRWNSSTKHDRSLRCCKHCDLEVVEDEHHFIFHCPRYESCRHEFRHLFQGTDGYNLDFFLNLNRQQDIANYLKLCLHIRQVSISNSTVP